MKTMVKAFWKIRKGRLKYKLGVAIIVKSLVLSNLWYLLCDGDGDDLDDDDDRYCDCHTDNNRNSTFWYQSHAMSHARNNGFDTAKTIPNVSQLMFVLVSRRQDFTGTSQGTPPKGSSVFNPILPQDAIQSGNFIADFCSFISIHHFQAGQDLRKKWEKHHVRLFDLMGWHLKDVAGTEKNCRRFWRGWWEEIRSVLKFQLFQQSSFKNTTHSFYYFTSQHVVGMKQFTDTKVPTAWVKTHRLRMLKNLGIFFRRDPKLAVASCHNFHKPQRGSGQMRCCTPRVALSLRLESSLPSLGVSWDGSQHVN